MTKQRATSPTPTGPFWIGDAPALAEALSALGSAPRLALDTEFIRERTYFPKLALLQIAHDGEVWLLDPLPADVRRSLAELVLAAPSVVMHSPGEDLEALAHHVGVLPRGLVDTQTAAALAGVGAGIGYQKLVDQVLGIALEKGETRSDWMRRPLSPAQLAYAADDVRHLDALVEVLEHRLRTLGRWAWLEEDCARLLAMAAEQTQDPYPHLAFKPAQGMDREAQIRLRRLLLWRDDEARQRDRPRGWVLDNPLCVRLAQRPPADRAAFEQVLDGHSGAPRRHRERLWEQINLPVTDEERGMPLLHRPGSDDQAALRRLQAVVAEQAAALEVPAATLAPRRLLEAWLRERRWPEAFAGWRESILSEPFERAL